MSQKVTIVEADPTARKALEKVLKKEGLEGSYIIQAADEPDQILVVRLDDFTKPVRAGAIVQQVRRLLSLQNGGEKLVSFGAYTLNPLSHELVDNASGKTTRLTEKESHILKLLAENPGKITSRKTLLDQVWKYADGIETHTLETHIYRLRQKIERDPANPSILITEEAGYRLN